MSHYWETSQLWHLLQIKHLSRVKSVLNIHAAETIYWGIFLKSWVYLNMSLTEKPHNCDICYNSNIFSLKSVLNIHAEKPFIEAFSIVHRYVSICYTLRNLTTVTFVTNQTFSRWSQSWIFTLRNHLLRHFPEVMGISKYVTYWETSQLWHLLQIKHFLIEVNLEYSRWETIYWGIFLKSWVYLNMSLTEKPHNCDICYKSNIFSLKSVLNIHAEKPFIEAFSWSHGYI